MQTTRQNTIDSLNPFGMPMQGRSYTSENYRFGFNGMEKDDEMKGEGNSLDFGARIYDSRLGRFLSVDPLMDIYPWQTPYAYFFNSPISIIDYFGMGDEDDVKTNSSTQSHMKAGIGYDINDLTWHKETKDNNTWITIKDPCSGDILGSFNSPNLEARKLPDGAIPSKMIENILSGLTYGENFGPGFMVNPGTIRPGTGEFKTTYAIEAIVNFMNVTSRETGMPLAITKINTNFDADNANSNMSAQQDLARTMRYSQDFRQKQAGNVINPLIKKVSTDELDKIYDSVYNLQFKIDVNQYNKNIADWEEVGF